MPITSPRLQSLTLSGLLGLVCVCCMGQAQATDALSATLKLSASAGLAQRDYAEPPTLSGSGTPVSSQEKGAVPLFQWQVQWQSQAQPQWGNTEWVWQTQLQGQHAQGQQTYQGYWGQLNGQVQAVNDRQHQQTQHSLRLQAGPLLRLSPTWQWGPQLSWQYQYSLRDLGQYTERFTRHQTQWGSTLHWQASPQVRLEWQHSQSLSNQNRLTATALGFSEPLSPSRQREQSLRLHWTRSPGQGAWQVELARQSQNWAATQDNGNALYYYPGATERQTRLLIGHTFNWP